MSTPQNNLINIHSPLQVIKIKTTDSPLFNNKLNLNLNNIINTNRKNNPSSLSPQLQNKTPSSPTHLNYSKFIKTSNNLNKFSKFFKKQIRTHEKNIKKNPRIKLIQNTHKIISHRNHSYNNRNQSFDKYILHSTKKLKIISENNGVSNQYHTFIPINLNINQYFISLPQNPQKDHKNHNLSQNNTHYNSKFVQHKTNDYPQQRRRKSQQSNRIYKGITSRKTSRQGRFSVQLQKHKQNQNDQFVQHQKINLYQSLINPQNLIFNHQNNKANNLGMPLTQSLGGQYSKIQRSQQNKLYQQDIYIRKKGKTRQTDRNSMWLKQLAISSGFPTKRGQINQPQVLTIHIKRPDNKFRSSLISRNDKNNHYHPRPVPISNINIFKRPNTTLTGMRNRRDSQIQPW